MSDADRPIRCFSAKVQMELRLNGSILRKSHLGRDFLIVSDPIEHPPTQAEVRMSIDGAEDRWPVYLPAGISAAVQRTRISRAESQ
jgi:hypothetical protein